MCERSLRPLYLALLCSKCASCSRNALVSLRFWLTSDYDGHGPESYALPRAISGPIERLAARL